MSLHEQTSLTRVVGVGEDCRERVEARARALRQLDHPHVMVPGAVRRDDDGRVAVDAPVLPGTDLAALGHHRGPLTLAECVWLGTELCRALAAMHAAGLVHGDISPGNVLVDGEVARIVDTVSGVLEHERGTPGFRAPERARGATVQADVYSIGALLRWCAEPAAQESVSAWAAVLTHRDPHIRPSLTAAAAALAELAEPAPVAVPVTTVVGAMRAQAVARTERIAAGRAWRVRRRVLTTAATVVAVGVGVSLVALMPFAVDAATPAPQPGYDPPMPIPAHAAATPARAAEHVSLERVRAIADGDADALRATVVGEGPVVSGVDDLARRIAEGVVVFEGLDAEVERVVVLSAAGRRTSALVSMAISGHRVRTPEGVREVEPYVESSVIDLRWVDDRWAVERVRPAP